MWAREGPGRLLFLQAIHAGFLLYSSQPDRPVASRAKPQRVKNRAPSERVIPKSVLAKEIAAILRQRQLTQTEAAFIMRDAPSQVSLVVTGKLRGFSTERLLRMLARLGRDVEIVIRPARGRTGKITVAKRG
jgi:predicted XRE-type DNA-binding protein